MIDLFMVTQGTSSRGQFNFGTLNRSLISFYCFCAIHPKRQLGVICGIPFKSPPGIHEPPHVLTYDGLLNDIAAAEVPVADIDYGNADVEEDLPAEDEEDMAMLDFVAAHLADGGGEEGAELVEKDEAIDVDTEEPCQKRQKTLIQCWMGGA